MTTRNLMKSYILRLLMVFVAGLLPIAGYSANIIAGTISGVVTGEKTGRAIGNAVIRVLDKSGQLVKSVVSNADGTFRVSNLPDGYYIIEAESGGMAKVVEVIEEQSPGFQGIGGQHPEVKIPVQKDPPLTSVNLQVPEEGGTAGIIEGGTAKGDEGASLAGSGTGSSEEEVYNEPPEVSPDTENASPFSAKGEESAAEGTSKVAGEDTTATSAAPQAAKGGILVWTGKNLALIGGIVAGIGAGIGAGIVIENNDDDHDHRRASPSE